MSIIKLAIEVRNRTLVNVFSEHEIQVYYLDFTVKENTDFMISKHISEVVTSTKLDGIINSIFNQKS